MTATGYGRFKPPGELRIDTVLEHEKQLAKVADSALAAAGVQPNAVPLHIGPQTIPLNVNRPSPAPQIQDADRIIGQNTPKPLAGRTLIKAPTAPVADEATVRAWNALEWGATTELSEWRREGGHPAILDGVPEEKRLAVKEYQGRLSELARQNPGYNDATQPLPPGYDPVEGEAYTAPLDPWRALLKK